MPRAPELEIADIEEAGAPICFTTSFRLMTPSHLTFRRRDELHCAAAAAACLPLTLFADDASCRGRAASRAAISP